MKKTTAAATAGLAAIAMSISPLAAVRRPKRRLRRRACLRPPRHPPPRPSRRAPPKPAEAEGAHKTIQDYIKEKQDRRSAGQPRRGVGADDQPSGPSGVVRSGPQTPGGAYGAILFEKPEDPSDPPSIIAIVSKLTGNVDPAKILEFAPGEVQNLSGFEAMGDAHRLN